MPSHQETKKLPYSAEQMFNLVSNIESYPEFLPWCIGARILNRDNQKQIVLAELVIGFKSFQERFVSRVKFSKVERIQVTYEKGPFEHLENCWEFVSCKEGCEIKFKIDFEFKSKVFRTIMEPLFYTAVTKMVAAFEKRAEKLYGASTASSKTS